MDQNDFIYLLGHFYARMGENTKAIGYFTSLLIVHFPVSSTIIQKR